MKIAVETIALVWIEGGYSLLLYGSSGGGNNNKKAIGKESAVVVSPCWSRH